MKDQRSFQQLSLKIGAGIPGWTQGPGGNVSVKDGNYLYIKASGKRLDALDNPQNIAALNLGILAKGLSPLLSAEELDDDRYTQLLRECTVPSPLAGLPQARPSMEAGFHALLPGKYVCHFHSLAAILLAAEVQRQPHLLRELCAQNPSLKSEEIAVIPFAIPGLDLTRQLNHYLHVPFLLLANHGVVLQLNAPEEFNRWENFENHLISKLFPLLATPEKIRLDGQSLRGRFRFLVPDAAVFRERMVKLIQESEQKNTKLHKGAQQTDRDMYELIWALCLLDTLNPHLSEIPADICAKIAHLPAEQFRKQQ